MFRIRVERVLNQDIEYVFQCLSEHQAYTDFPSVDLAQLLEEGSLHKNGAGAVRLIGSGWFKLRERITLYEPPYRMDYLIEQAKPFAFQHDKGQIMLAEEEGGTKVIWISEGHVLVPLIGQWLDRKMEQQGARLFHSVLKCIDRRDGCDDGK